MTENTTNSILEALERMAQEKRPIEPNLFLEAAMKLVSLMGAEHDRLFTLENSVARQRITLLEAGMTVSGAKMHSEASAEYLEARKLKAKIERVLEIIRISKIRARLSSEEMRAN